MTTRKKKSSLLKKLNSKYKLAIFNEQTYEEVFVFRLSRLNAFTMVGAFGIVLIVLVTLLIAFTSLREFIPGYPSPNERLLIVRNAQRADSLSFEIQRQVRFIENMQARLRGEEPELGEGPGDKTKVASTSGTRDDIQFKKSDEDAAFRKSIEKEEKFNLSVKQTTTRVVSLENTFFFSPIKGMVVNAFGDSKGHYGVDVVAQPGARVSAIMDGTIVFSGWTVETGYVLQIQHPNNLISIYKHNEQLLKEVGQTVKSGEAIARVGNSGELTTGPHLHFELWHNGIPLNPEEYITF
jgi:murein DD-endopeptidase MepM/ murein hydrolase activator NlpD